VPLRHAGCDCHTVQQRRAGIEVRCRSAVVQWRVETAARRVVEGYNSAGTRTHEQPATVDCVRVVPVGFVPGKQRRWRRLRCRGKQ